MNKNYNLLVRVLLIVFVLVPVGFSLAQYGYGGETDVESAGAVEAQGGGVQAGVTVESKTSVSGGSGTSEDAKTTQYNESNLEFVKTRAESSDTKDEPVTQGGAVEVLPVVADDAGSGQGDNVGLNPQPDPPSAKAGQLPVLIDRATPILIKAVEVRGWDAEKKKEFLGTVREHAQVQSEKDLENFAIGVLLEDENTESISLNYTKVKVDYKMPAKFLGVFNSSLTAQVEVDSESRVKVRYPWTRFLFSKSVSSLEIEQAVQGAISEDAQLANIDLQNSLQHQSRVLQTISNVSKTMHDTAMSIIRNIK